MTKAELIERIARSRNLPADISKKDIENFARWFQRWGQAGNFVARLLPIVRTFISFPAGVFRISFWPFALLTFVSSFIWCGMLGLVGFFLGDHWESILGIMGPLKYPIILGVVAFLIYYIYHHLPSSSRWGRPWN